MSQRGFSDPAVAQKARDALVRLMIRTLDQERPPYQYGTVTQIDADLGSCLVLLPGDPTAVRVKFGSMRPSRVGQVVRISGYMNDRFISDVIGGAVVADQPVDNLAAPTGVTMSPSLEAVTMRWNAMPEASRYEAQFADDSAFSVNLRSFQTINNAITQSNLNAGTVVYGRVRALTSYNGTGPWSATVSATPTSVPPAESSDGIAPASSPQPVISSGIGYLLAEWLPTSNVDQVTYEVHLSATSGFTPSSSTKLGEVTGTFYFIRRLPGGGNLVYGTTYFVRLIAKDADGSAPAGAQGSGAPQQVEGSDVGRIPTSEIGDGNAPTSSPTPTVTNGIGYLYATWTHTANADATTYEVHVSVTSGFTPSSNTLVGSTESNFIFIRKQGPGGSPANGELAYGTTYFVKLIAKDVDGQAAAGGQGSGTPVKATTTDIGDNAITTGHIQAGSITAASAIIADAAIGTAKIQDAAITTAKIGTAQITSALIGNLQVLNAHIADATISTAKIGDAQITNAKIDNVSADKILTGTLGATVAITIASGGVINSSNYIAGSTGFQIRGDGSAEFNNVTVRGRIEATGGGATVQFGNDVGPASSWTHYGLTLDATTFNNIFLRRSDGVVFFRVNQGGTSSITYDSSSGVNIDGGTITGGLIRTAVSGRRIETTTTQLMFFTNSAGEVTPGRIGATVDALSILGPDFSGGRSQITLLNTNINILGQLRPEQILFGVSTVIPPYLAMADYPIYIRGASDTNHMMQWHSGFDGPQITAAGGVTLRSVGNDVMEMVGTAANVRTVNGANSAFRDHLANDHTNMSDPKVKRDIRSPAKNEFLNIVKGQRPFGFKFVEGWGDNKERYGVDASKMPVQVQADMGMTKDGQPLKGVSTASAIALLWGAIADLADEVALRHPPNP